MILRLLEIQGQISFWRGRMSPGIGIWYTCTALQYSDMVECWPVTQTARVWSPIGENVISIFHLLHKDSKNDPCVHPLSWIIRWNLFKLAEILHWDEGKKWLDFGDLDLIFKVTLTLWHSNFDRKKLMWHIDINKVYLHKRKYGLGAHSFGVIALYKIS